MEIVTGFDNGFVEGVKPPQLPGEEYDKIVVALEHSQEVAENVFARVSKEQFRKQVDHKIQRIRLDELEEGVQQGFCETCLVLSQEDIRAFTKGVFGATLADHTRLFGDYMLRVVIDDRVLVDSLSTKIMRSGSLFQFRWKQRWAHHG